MAANSERIREVEARYYTGIPILSHPPEYVAEGKRGKFQPQFVISFTPASRWFEFDTGGQVWIYTKTEGAPTPEGASPEDIVNDMAAAMNAWSSIPGCNVRLASGGIVSQCTDHNVPLGYNTIAFNNCDNMFTPSACNTSMALAMTYLKSTGEPVLVNGRGYYKTVEAHV